MANNFVIERIEGITNWINANPNIIEPNMREMMECLVQLSELDGQERKEALNAFSEMYNARFGNPRCPNRTETSMWKLFSAVFSEVQKESYKINEHTEAELLCMLMGIGNYCHQLKKECKKYDNHVEFKQLSHYKENYLNSENPKFEMLVEAAFQEIQECYKK